MTIKAIPTRYANCQFRSRLEARWAAFFDLLGWKWEYEPTDDGAWVPDFIIRGVCGPIPVEVKPIEWHDYLEPVEQVEARKDLAKVFNSPRDDILVLGAYLPNYEGCFPECPTLGVIVREGGGYNDPAKLSFSNQNGKIEFFADTGSYHGRIYGGPKAYSTHSPDGETLEQKTERLWREAGNAVQWRSPVKAAS